MLTSKSYFAKIKLCQIRLSEISSFRTVLKQLTSIAFSEYLNEVFTTNLYETKKYFTLINCQSDKLAVAD